MQELVQSGGLMNYIRKKIEKGKIAWFRRRPVRRRLPLHNRPIVPTLYVGTYTGRSASSLKAPPKET